MNRLLQFIANRDKRHSASVSQASAWGGSSNLPDSTVAPSSGLSSSGRRFIAEHSAWSAAFDAASLAWQLAQHNATVNSRVICAVAAQLWDSRDQPRGRPIHVRSDHTLLAVLDTNKLTVAIRVNAQLTDLIHLNTVFMPQSAADAPVGFVTQPLWDVLWHFGVTDPAASMLVPGDIASRKIHMRRLPLITPGLLEVRHTLILRELSRQDLTFEQLCALAPTPASVLCKDIAALYLTRSISFR